MTQERATQGQPQVKGLQILIQEGKYGPNTSAQKMSNLTPGGLFVPSTCVLHVCLYSRDCQRMKEAVF
jgi:hypothetical protein